MIVFGPKSDHCLALSVSHSISALVEFCSNYICQSSCMNLSKNDEWKFSHGFVKIDMWIC